MALATFSLRVVCLGWLVCLSPVSGQDDDFTKIFRKKQTLTGQVTDHNGPVSDARIFLFDDQLLAEVSSDESGQFAMDFKSGGFLKLLVLAKGKSAFAQVVDQDRLDIHVQLAAPSKIPRGRVIDNQGNGVENCLLKIVTIRLDDLTLSIPSDISHAMLITESTSDGAFAFDSIDVNLIESISLSGDGIVTSFIKRSEFDAEFIHVAQPSRRIRGKVVDRVTRKPLSDVLISQLMNQSATSDENGNFELEGLPAFESATLTATPAGDLAYHAHTKSIPPALALEPVEVEIELEQAAWIQAKVSDFGSGGPARAQVYYFPSPDNDSFRLFLEQFQLRGSMPSVPTNAFGLARLAGASGPGVVAVYTDGYPPTSSVKELSQEQQSMLAQISNRTDLVAVEFIELENLEQELELEFIVSKGKSIVLEVPTAQRHLVNQLVVHNLSAKTAPAKRIDSPIFSAEQFHPGEQRQVFVHDPVSQLGAVVDVSAELSGPVIVNLEKTGSIQGRIVDENGNPQPGLKIKFEISSRVNQEITAPVFTDANGQFEKFSLLANLDYQISAIRLTTNQQMMQGLPEADSKWMLHKQLNVKPDEAIDLGQLLLGAEKQPEPTRYFRQTKNPADYPLVVNGLVVNQNGEAIEGASISLNTWSKSIEQEGVDLLEPPTVLTQSTSDASGCFQMVVGSGLTAKMLTSGSGLNATLVVRADRYGGNQLPISDLKSAANIKIQLAPEMVLRGKLKTTSTVKEEVNLVVSSQVRVFNPQTIKRVLSALKNGKSFAEVISEIPPDVTLDPMAGGLPVSWTIDNQVPFRIHGMPVNAIFQLKIMESGADQTWYVVSRPSRPFDFKVEPGIADCCEMQGSRITVEIVPEAVSESNE